ncbi:MAG: pilus assembly protein PilC [Bdellovibrionaceae bacterium]|nr:pilus assembly protein PilC [Pseudobdellovibrionaceae bacterium]|tara:strand:- start:4504 stop:5721 length:1218 start_codon:yes stop_codon:yes gene_type:complete
MPQYEYQGVNKSGERVTGMIDVPNEGELRMYLRGQGIRPVRISKASLMKADLGSMIRGSSQSISPLTLITFTRQLHVLISSGVPLVQGLDALVEQTADSNMKNIISVIKERVSQGSFFWEALAQYPKAFPKIYLSLVRAGEASGALEVMLKRLSRYMEDAERLRKLVKSAMIYPIAVIAVGVIVIAVMLTMVIPKFETILTQSGQELPAPTKFVISLSHFMVDNILSILVVTGIGGFLALKFFKSPEGKAVLDRLFFKAPLLGTIMQKSGVARFSRTMGTLLASGVNMIDSIDICRETINNVVLEDATAKIREEVETGKTLGQVVSKIGVFPPMAMQMISIGENTGNLDRMLERVADFYESEVETLVGGLTKLIEPFVLVVLGGAVGGIMIAMYLPIFKLAGGGN